MRGGAEWIAEKEKVNDLDPTPSWVDIGYSISDPMLLLIIIATVCAGVAVRSAVPLIRTTGVIRAWPRTGTAIPSS